ncbi:hypothetical protein D9M71_100530 [compost metagenome]
MIQRFTYRLQTLAGPGVSGHDDRKLILVGQGSQRLEQIPEVFRRIDIFLSVSADDEKFVLLQTLSNQHIGRENFRHVVVEHFLHMRTGFDDGFRTNPFGDQITPGMLGQNHIDIAQVIEHLAIQFLGNSLIETAIAGFHMEYRYLAALCGNHC